ncbi:MAG: TonB-dependent receptor [Cyclobacteriaceae bacterium]|nr:TonB-dependent receptor [Cyclobacteriaceae bacterium]
MKRNLLIVCLMALGTFALAQTGTIKGRILDQDTNEALIGANAVIKGTTQGATTDVDGYFTIENVQAGTVTVNISYVGYEPIDEKVTVVAGKTVNMGNVSLGSSTIGLDELEIIASRTTAETPFTFSDVKKAAIQESLGSRDLPAALNLTPSFYSTNAGGGAGDSRLNVRGFNQRNVAIMINGVPVNDMENGWVYWSNWDGLGDAASSIQIQRGTSPVNLATPSIGGTMNIITDPAGKTQGVYLKQEFGSWNFKKTTVTYNSGLMNDKFAVSATLAKKSGDGFYEGTYTDALAYYLGMSYQINKNNKLEGFLIGAPQFHGQNLYMQNIARYSYNYAASLDDYDRGAFAQYKEAGRNFNQNYNKVTVPYNENQYYTMYGGKYSKARLTDGYIMERENYFHKPQLNINYYNTINDKMQWTTIAYYSGGRGGGSGTYGSVSADYSYQGMGRRNWDAEILQNQANDDGSGLNASTGILRNSVNNQWTLGAISKLFYEPSDNLKFQAGIDYRTAKIEHYREVRDLLGGDYYRYTGNEFETEEWQYRKGLGGKVNYFNTNTVNWLGFYGQGEYTTDKIGAFLMAGYTMVGYGYTNHFVKGNDGNELTAENKGLPGYQVKGGFTYKFNSTFNAYLNAGYIAKNPIFDAAINDTDGTTYDPLNEKFLTYEAGISYRPSRNSILNVSYYNTNWKDRTLTRTRVDQSGNETLIFISGLSQTHGGLEIEGSYQFGKMLRVDGGLSFANWQYDNDVSSRFTTYDTNNNITQQDVNLYISGLKVGDAPQNQLALSATFTPVKAFSLKLDYRYYTKYYSEFDPVSRTDENDRTQSWQVPNYDVVDLHAFYTLPLRTEKADLQIFAHVFNLMDDVYVQDAIDNSSFNSYNDDHSADDAEVFLGLPRNINFGFTLRF